MKLALTAGGRDFFGTESMHASRHAFKKMAGYFVIL